MEDAEDRRRRIIVLTAKGERQLEKLRPSAAKAQERALSVFSEEEAALFLSLLEKFVNKFNGVTRAPLVQEIVSDETPEANPADDG